jgi:uncharacterized protein (DUF342 family)
MSRNAFFQIINKNDGLYIAIEPPADGGAKLVFAEVRDYLERNGIADINMLALEDALEVQTGKKEARISKKTVPPLNEELTVVVTDNRMRAHARCYPPSEGGRQISKGDIMRKIAETGVKSGIKEDVIDEWLENRQYCADIPIAEGLPAGESRDASIEYTFSSSKEFKPTIDERGVIDFHHLNLIVHVEEGDVLAVLTPAVEGEPGRDVFGDVVPVSKPVEMELKPVQNAVVSDDGCKLVSLINGHVEMVHGTIVLNNLYTIKGDVGTGTGDVEYDGSVKITGDVREGYAVKATGDIFVDGVVEAANLRAGGKIILTKGAHSGGWLKAGGDIVSKFLEVCTVISGGSVTSGAILHSNVAASDSIIVDDQKGVIMGGELRARSLISAKAIGATSGAPTLVEVGADPSVMDEYHALKMIIAEKKEEQQKLQKASEHIQRKIQNREPLKPEQTELFKTLSHQISVLDIEVTQLLKRRAELKTEIESSNTGKVVIKGPVYDGTRIVISNMPFQVAGTIFYCQFLISGGEVKSYAI